MVKKLRLFLIVISLIFLQSGFIYAQADVELFKPGAGKKIKREECLKNFNIDTVDFNQPVAKKNRHLLSNYFQCKAAINNDISICDWLSFDPELVDFCKRNFNTYVSFLGSALIKGVTPGAIDSCTASSKDKNMSRERCKAFLEGLITRNSAVCDRLEDKKKDECRALIEGRANLCSEPPCQHKVFFIEAIRSNNIEKCGYIQDEMIRSICQADVMRKKSVCEDNDTFQTFKEIYCGQ